MDERALADSLDRFLNGLASGKESGGEIDPELARIARRYHALGQLPAPSGARNRVQRRILSRTEVVPSGCEDRPVVPLPTPTHANRRRKDLVHAASTPLMPGASRNGGAPTHLLQPIAPRISRPHQGFTVLTRAAAAVLLVALMASAAVALLYPLRPWEAESDALVAGAETPAAEAAQPQATTLLDLTLADIPTFRAKLGMRTTRIPPGSSSEHRSGAGPQVVYVAAGPLTVRARTATEPLWVIPPGSAGAETSKDLVAQGQQATLATGATLLVPAGAVVDLFTTGSAPAQVMELLWATNSAQHDDGGVTSQFASNGGSIQDLSPPVSIVLRQATLEPDATFSAPESGDTHQVMAPLDPKRMGDLRSGSDWAVRNAGDQPVEIYILTVAESAAATLAPPDTAP